MIDRIVSLQAFFLLQRLCCFLAIVLVCAVGNGQAPKLEVSVSSDWIFEGETLDFQVDVQNVAKPSSPDMSAVKQHFDVELLGDQARDQSTTLIINGRMTQKNVFSHVYIYRLTPKSSGKLTIPSLELIVEGKTIESQSVQIEVSKIEVQDNVLIEIIPSQTEVYPTQSFSLKLKLLVRPLPDSDRDPLLAVRRTPPQLKVDWIDPPDGLSAMDKAQWLQSMLARNGVGFTLNDFSMQSGSFFDAPRKAVFDIQNGRETRPDLQGDDVEYFVYEMTREFTANRSGEYVFENASVKGTFVVEKDQSEYQGRRIVAIAPSVRVLVKEVPTPRPDSFIGGIGKYQAKASASPMELRVGDPLTFSLEFRAGKKSGPLDLIAAPNLSNFEEIARDFEIVDSNPTGRMEGESKQFSYSLRPKRAGVTLPALKLNTFDPEVETFSELPTTPISIAVSEASAIGSNEIVGTLSKSNNSTIKRNETGIFGNITDPGTILDERASLRNCVGSVGGCWGFAAICVVFIKWKQRNVASPSRQRKSRAKQTALAALTLARNRSVAPRESLRLIRQAILGLVADSQGLNIDGMTKLDVEIALKQSGASTEDQFQATRLLEQLEAMEYGSGTESAPNEWIASAESLVKRLAPVLNRTRIAGVSKEST